MKCLAYLFNVSIITLRIPRSYLIQSFYNPYSSSKVNFKVTTNTSGKMNLNRSSPTGLTVPYWISRSKAPDGFSWFPLNMDMSPNKTSSLFIICTYFEAKLLWEICSLFFGLHFTLSRMEFPTSAENLAVNIFVNC